MKIWVLLFLHLLSGGSSLIELNLFENVQYYLSTPKFNLKVAEDILKELEDANIRCIISGGDPDSLQMADYLTLHLMGVNWFGIDPKISGEILSPEKYPRFREKYLISPEQVKLSLRIPFDCNRVLVIATEQNLRKLLSFKQRLPPGSISRLSSNEQEFAWMEHLHNETIPGNAFDYLYNLVKGFFTSN